MIKILDLFAGTQSVRKALTKKYDVEYWKQDEKIKGLWKGYHLNPYKSDPNTDILLVEYIGIDIVSPEYANIILDLTKDDIVKLLKAKLPENWIPDIIWASPVCDKLSGITFLKGGDNAYFKLNRETQTIRPWKLGEKSKGGRKTYIDIPGSPEGIKDAENTLKMFNNTKEIVNFFNVPFIIENPSHSLTKYLMKDYIHNKCNYCMYGFNVFKGTYLFSNVELNLLKCKDHKKGDHVYIHRNGKNQADNLPNIKTYDERASVPPQLIEEAFTQLLEGVNND